jgi:hypothetical protein
MTFLSRSLDAAGGVRVQPFPYRGFATETGATAQRYWRIG